MKKFLLMCFLYCFALFPAFGYTQDTELQKCLKNAGANYSSQYDCYCIRKEFYQKENAKLLKELQTVLPNNSYQKLLSNQQLLSQYLTFLNNGELKILNSTLGLMYQTFGEEILLSVNKTNNQLLNILKNPKYNCNKPQNNDSINKLNEKLIFYFNDSEKNFSKKEYDLIANSQKTWLEYKSNTINQILSLSSSTAKTKNYIKRMLLQDRISTLFDVNLIIYETQGFPELN